MSKNTKLAKCPYCCPDVAGAIFERTWDLDRDERCWECRNCGTYIRANRRSEKPTTKMTPSQKHSFDLVLERFETPVIEKQEFIGRKLWIQIKDENKFQSVSGTIGAGGKFNLNSYSYFISKHIKKTSQLCWI